MMPTERAWRARTENGRPAPDSWFDSRRPSPDVGLSGCRNPSLRPPGTWIDSVDTWLGEGGSQG